MPWRLGKPALAAALERSLDRLGLRKVDVCLLHFPTPPVSLETWADALADAVQEGLTRTVGISNCSAEQTRRAHAALLARGVSLAVNEAEYSLLKRAPEHNGLLPLCRNLGVTLIAYRPLAMCLLSGKYTQGNLPRWRLTAGEIAELDSAAERMPSGRKRRAANAGPRLPMTSAVHVLLFGLGFDRVQDPIRHHFG